MPDVAADLAQQPLAAGLGLVGGERRVRRRAPALLEPLQPVQAAQERALAAARRPDDRRDLARAATESVTPREDVERRRAA